MIAVHLCAGLPSAPVLAAACLPALAPWRGRALWAATVLGVLLTVWRAQGLLDERWPVEAHGSDRVLEGRIAGLPERDAQSLRFLFAPDAPRNAAVPRRIRVAWYDKGAAVRGGECWRFTLRLRTPHGSLNPGGFDYEGWMFRSRIGATATVREAVRRDCASRDRVLEWRQVLVDAIARALPKHPAAPVLAALTVGDESTITSEDWEVFRATGTSHLVAISGFNIALVAGVAFFLCRWLWSAWPPLCLRLPAQRAALLGSAAIAGLYALLAGFDAPVQRAVLMLWIVLAALWTHRASRPSRVLALAWLAILVLDPLAIASPGLWLSFGAVAAIFYVSLGRLRAPGFWHGAVTLQWLLAVALAPLTLFFFQGASWAAPLVNLLAVPFFTLLTPWALGGLLLYVAWPAAGLPVLESAAFMLELFRRALAWLASGPELLVPAAPSFAALLVALVGVALLFAPRGLPLRALGLVCLVPLFAGGGGAPPPRLSVTALDVGQGLAVVLRTSHHALLYDAGPAFDEGFDAGASIVAPYLLREGLRDLDLLLLSHGDRDHSGGVAAVRRKVHVHAEIGTASPCLEGTRWNWDGVSFEILNGPAPGRSDNDGGCVLQVRSPEFSVLLPADVEAATEARLVSRYGERLRSDLLLTPHHGSKTSSTPEFVAAVRPKWVIHSAGWRHHFHHPRPEVVARYAGIGAVQFTTGVEGAVEVGRDDDGEFRIGGYRREAAKFWNAAPEP